MHARPPQTHTHTLQQREPVMHLDADATHPQFFFPPITHTPPQLFPYPRLPVCLYRSHSLSGFFNLFPWSLESGRSRSSSWRGTGCGPEKLQRQFASTIQHVTTDADAAAPTLAGSGHVSLSGKSKTISCAN